MQRSRWISVLVLTISLVLGMGVVTSAEGAAPSEHAQSSALVMPRAAKAPDNYTPPRGMKVNNPLTKRKRVILKHIIRSINSTPRGEQIRIASWNIRSDAFVDALIRAHQRGVSVRVIISYGNANPDLPNAGFNRLQRNLKQGNAQRTKSMVSWGRKCRSSCRGKRGIAHTKMFLFSKVGQATDVVMYTSANATELAAGYQWNDIYTMHSRTRVYRDFIGIFNQMAEDQPARPAYVGITHGNFRSEFLPWAGKNATGDPVTNELNKIRCKGATGDAGNKDGRTVIRIAQTATLAARGQRIATRIKELWDLGCDIKIIYAVMGNKVLNIYRQTTGRGPVPIQQIAQDWNEDGVYDRYLHMKVMTVSGRYGADRSAKVVFNGSQNWTGLALLSDEAGGRIFHPITLGKYNTWINYLFNNPPPGAAPRGRAMATNPEARSTKTKVKYGGIEW